MYTKSILKSISDQQLLLSTDEMEQKQFKWASKVIHYTTTPLIALAAENFNLSTLAITGLTKLVPRSAQSAHSHNEDAVKVFNFSVDSHSIAECSDEGLMQDIKIEINSNKWEKLVALGDIVSSSLGHLKDNKHLTINTASSYNVNNNSSHIDQHQHNQKVFPLMGCAVSPHESDMDSPPSSAKAFPASPLSAAPSICSDSSCSSPRIVPSAVDHPDRYGVDAF
jgi:hypothetical protein